MSGPINPTLNAFIQSNPILQSIWLADQQTLALDQQPVNNINSEISSLQSQQSTWQSLNSNFLSVYTDTQNLLQPSFWNQTAAVSSNTAVLTVTGNSAQAGTYSVSVSSLAEPEIDNGTAQSSSTTALGLSGTPSINGQTFTVTTSDTLQDIVNIINTTANIGVTASIIGGNTIEITGNTPGQAITYADNGGVLQGLGLVTSTNTPAHQYQAPSTAALTVNGVSMSGLTTNSVTTAIPGLTLSLLATGSSTVTVTTDISAMVKGVQTLVNDYNTAVQAANAQIASTNPITGSTELQDTIDQMAQIISSTVTNSVTAQDLGITFNQAALQSTSFSSQSGTLTLNTTTLTQELQSNFSGAQQEIQAIAQQLGTQLNYLTEPGGTIAEINQSISSQVSSLQEELTFAQQNYQMQQEELLNELATLAQALLQMQAATQYVGTGSSSQG